MARVNLTIPDGVLAQARAAGLNLSAVATEALREAIARRERMAELDAYLAELDAALGPVSAGEAAEAAEWARRLPGSMDGAASA